jgi:hypothetical protein
MSLSRSLSAAFDPPKSMDIAESAQVLAEAVIQSGYLDRQRLDRAPSRRGLPAAELRLQPSRDPRLPRELIEPFRRILAQVEKGESKVLGILMTIGQLPLASYQGGSLLELAINGSVVLGSSRIQ